MNGQVTEYDLTEFCARDFLWFPWYPWVSSIVNFLWFIFLGPTYNTSEALIFRNFSMYPQIWFSDFQIWKGHCMVIKPSHNFQRGLNLKLESNLVFIVQPFTYKNLQTTMHSYNHYPGFLTTKDTLPYFISLWPHTSEMASTNNQN